MDWIAYLLIFIAMWLNYRRNYLSWLLYAFGSVLLFVVGFQASLWGVCLANLIFFIASIMLFVFEIRRDYFQ
jgi:hypothetical protein